MYCHALGSFMGAAALGAATRRLTSAWNHLFPQACHRAAALVDLTGSLILPVTPCCLFLPGTAGTMLPFLLGAKRALSRCWRPAVGVLAEGAFILLCLVASLLFSRALRKSSRPLRDNCVLPTHLPSGAGH